MHFTTLIFAALSIVCVSVSASPLIEERQGFMPCSGGLYSQAQCCATGVLGAAALDCTTPRATPTDATDFQQVCAAVGQSPRCCVLALAGLGVLCTDPVGVQG